MIGRLWRRLFGRPTSPPDRPGRTEQCGGCGVVLPIDDAHLVVSAWDDPETGGGTAMSAAYCPACCPDAVERRTVDGVDHLVIVSSCNHPEEHL